MIRLEGTIPITFKGARYNIPVVIDIPENYPLAAPRCYVTPTQSMILVPNHAHVEMDVRDDSSFFTSAERI